MAGPVIGRPLPPAPPLVRVASILSAAEVPVVAAAPATEVALAEVAAVLATNVAVTQAGLATVASTAAANSALLLTATNTVASTAAANSVLLLAATNTVASTAAANSALLLTATEEVAAAVEASDAVLVQIRDAVVAPPPVSVNNFPATQPVSGAVSVSNFPVTQPVSGSVANTPVQNSGKTVNRYVLSQVGVAGTAIVAAASPGNKHKIIGVLLTVSAAATVKFTDTGNLTGAMNLPSGGIINIPPNPTFPLVETLTNRALNVVTTGGGANGVILFLTEP